MRTRELDSLYLRAPRLNQFNILRLLAGDARITQAELARRCGLSVAMVNNYLKDLFNAGMLEYRRKSSRSVTYHVTEGGMAQVETLQRDLIEEMADFFAESKARVRDHILSHAAMPLKQVVLLGSGNLAELVCHALKGAGVRVIGVCAPDSPDLEWCGHLLMDVSQVRSLAPDAVIVAVCRLTQSVRDCLWMLEQQGVPLLCANGDSIRRSSDSEHPFPALAVVNG